MKHAALAFALACLLTAPAIGHDLAALVSAQLPGLVATYKDIHSHPELSHHEERTSALLAAELRKSGYTVSERVGKYPDGSQAYGVVAILKNGPGGRLLIRADMDALPIREETGLTYASHVTTKDAGGRDVGSASTLEANDSVCSCRARRDSAGRSRYSRGDVASY